MKNPYDNSDYRHPEPRRFHWGTWASGFLAGAIWATIIAVWVAS